MLKSETSMLLARISQYDGREIDQVAVELWHETIFDLDYPDAVRAVTEHYRASRYKVMPAEIIARVAVMEDVVHEAAVRGLEDRHRSELRDHLGIDDASVSLTDLRRRAWEHAGEPNDVEAARNLIRRQDRERRSLELGRRGGLPPELGPSRN
ncbi:hypothetical protein GCM10009846_03880 [Agrococcus versicolor]|uniref:Replicative helicase inhibitor G39P N-terminal domain-containing protein n=1 Tax=Agrococcus versicolor TaxID=501482 RepID=A0ABP5M9R0_9MICO